MFEQEQVARWNAACSVDGLVNGVVKEAVQETGTRIVTTRNESPRQYAGNWERSLIKKTCTAIFYFFFYTYTVSMSERGGVQRTGVASPHMQPFKSVSISSNRPVQMNLFATWEIDRSSPSCVPRWVRLRAWACARELARGVTGCIASSPCHVVTLVTPCMTQSLSWNLVWRNPSLYNVQFPPQTLFQL